MALDDDYFKGDFNFSGGDKNPANVVVRGQVDPDLGPVTKQYGYYFFSVNRYDGSADGARANLFQGHHITPRGIFKQDGELRPFFSKLVPSTVH